MNPMHMPCMTLASSALHPVIPAVAQLMSYHKKACNLPPEKRKLRAEVMHLYCRPVKALGFHPFVTAVAQLAGVYGLGILMTLSAYAGYVVLAIILEVAEKLSEEFLHSAVARKSSLCMDVVRDACALASRKTCLQGALTP